MSIGRGVPLLVSDRGFRWRSSIPRLIGRSPRAWTVLIDLSGEIYGAMTPITAFTAGTES